MGLKSCPAHAQEGAIGSAEEAAGGDEAAGKQTGWQECYFSLALLEKVAAVAPAQARLNRLAA